tara:strand:- start:12 stop:1127 length:1116 start_codon:yes stop_codon:yes gene_type:complete
MPRSTRRTEETPDLDDDRTPSPEPVRKISKAKPRKVTIEEPPRTEPAPLPIHGDEEEPVTEAQPLIDGGTRKMKATNDVENPSQSEEVKEKMKATNLDRFGVEDPLQNAEVAAHDGGANPNQDEAAEANELDELDESDESDGDEDESDEGDEDGEGLFDDDSTDFEEDDDVEWPASTVMYLPRVIDEKLLAYFKKYLEKDSNRGRLFRPSTTSLFDEDQQDELEELEEIVDESFRKCHVARETQTLQKLYNMLEKTIDEAADKFIEKFNFFSIVSTKEEYTLLNFAPGDFHKEHIECSSLTDESDGSSRRICVYLILETPEKGGSFDFTYQGTRIKPDPGSVLMFPSCPLHPVKLTKVGAGSLMMVTNYLL